MTLRALDRACPAQKFPVGATTGGALSGIAFGSFILWMLTSAILMLRRPPLS